MKVIEEKPEDEMESESESKTPTRCTKKSVEEDFRPICHGWLIVCGKCTSFSFFQWSLDFPDFPSNSSDSRHEFDQLHIVTTIW